MRKLLLILLILPLLAVGQIASFDSDITYKFAHGLVYKDSTTYTINNTARYRYYKISPSWTIGENDYITLLQDCVIVQLAGDYFFDLATAFDGADRDDWHIKLFKNGQPLQTPFGAFLITTMGVNYYTNSRWYWYQTLAVGDVISFRIANNSSATNDPTFRSFKLYIEKKPEK
jgi:hypothetical protein